MFQKIRENLLIACCSSVILSPVNLKLNGQQDCLVRTWPAKNVTLYEEFLNYLLILDLILVTNLIHNFIICLSKVIR